MLEVFNIHLHKLTSNSPVVLEFFPYSEVSVLTEPSDSTLSVRRALGVVWDANRDTFSRNILTQVTPVTKRDVLATDNAPGYDPAGLISPVTLVGELFQNEILPTEMAGSKVGAYDCDQSLTESFRPGRNALLESLEQLPNIKVAHSFYPVTFTPASQELHTFCDASEDAIGHVIYLPIHSISSDGKMHHAFVTIGSSVAPSYATTIPRLELFLVAEATKAALFVVSELESNNIPRLCLPPRRGSHVK